MQNLQNVGFTNEIIPSPDLVCFKKENEEIELKNALGNA